MADTLITETGDTLKMETVPGIALASSLNDISVVTINKEEFETDPTDRGWLIGTDWVYSAANQRIQVV